MGNHEIVPEKITKPIQLLAAWLIGLIIVDGAFLTAATQLNSPSWASGALIVAAIVNVPLFLTSIFLLLQTKFRPEMQEDVYYSKYLEYQQTDKSVARKAPDIEAQIENITRKIVKELGSSEELSSEPIKRILHDSEIEQITDRLAGSRSLSELFLRPQHWSALVDTYGHLPGFVEDITRLIEASIVTMVNGDYYSCKLTEFGTQVAKDAQRLGFLFAQEQTNRLFWEKEEHVHRSLQQTR